MIEPGEVYCGDAIRLLNKMEDCSVDHVITDAMFGGGIVKYDWGSDPARGKPDKHWEYHQPYWDECLRVLRPGGILAWCQGFNFADYFDQWFGTHWIWTLVCVAHGLNFNPSLWVVRTKEGEPVYPPKNMVMRVDRRALKELKKLHPCPKTTEEMTFMVRSLTKPGDIILDPFCGTGTTLVAAERLGRRWIGCDKSRAYGRLALRRLKSRGITSGRGESISCRSQFAP